MSGLDMQFVEYKGLQLSFEVFRQHRDNGTLDQLLEFRNKVIEPTKNEEEELNEDELLEGLDEDLKKLEEARKQYLEKFGKEVALSKKNDLEWIQEKLNS